MSYVESSLTCFRIVACVACLMNLSVQPTWSQTSLQPGGFLDQLNNSLKDLAERVSPAVVEVKVLGYGVDDDAQDSDEDSTHNIVKQHVDGAGVILDPNGYIITNAHLIEGAKRVQVILNPTRTAEMAVRTYIDSPGRTFDADIVGVHQEADLAVLKIHAKGLPTLQFANYENLKQGQMVVAFGSPLGFRNTATIGIVSSIARQIDPDSPVVFVQTDAAINPGNSGGALVDTAGNLVGINTAMLKAERAGLAIPSDTVKFVYDQIRKFGRVVEGDMGLSVQTITPTMVAGLKLRREVGVIVADVRPGFPAEKVGVQSEDIITAADGQPVQSALQFLTIVYRRKPGDRISLRLLRGVKSLDVNVVLVEKTLDSDPLSQAVDVDRNLISMLNVVGLDVDNSVAATVPGIRMRSGVLVTGKCSKREGTQTALKVGDLIHAINGTTVHSVAEVRSLLAKLSSGSPVVLRVERQKQFMYLVSEVE
ncbi:MAG TPA: trypsin-like peptidase domain-containing protein [Terriglobales bacterium]|nr:trypsin-like peptidase domain-containing protein [Terriglobales bacterium]